MDGQKRRQPPLLQQTLLQAVQKVYYHHAKFGEETRSERTSLCASKAIQEVNFPE